MCNKQLARMSSECNSKFQIKQDFKCELQGSLNIYLGCNFTLFPSQFQQCLTITLVESPNLSRQITEPVDARVAELAVQKITDNTDDLCHNDSK